MQCAQRAGPAVSDASAPSALGVSCGFLFAKCSVISAGRVLYFPGVPSACYIWHLQRSRCLHWPAVCAVLAAWRCAPRGVISARSRLLAPCPALGAKATADVCSGLSLWSPRCDPADRALPACSPGRAGCLLCPQPSGPAVHGPLAVCFATAAHSEAFPSFPMFCYLQSLLHTISGASCTHSSDFSARGTHGTDSALSAQHQPYAFREPMPEALHL